MSFKWRKITKDVWQLDEHYQVVKEPGYWHVYRDGVCLLSCHVKLHDAMSEAERRSKNHEL